MTISINLTEEEKRLADSYTKIHSVSLEDAFKEIFFEKIEDDYDTIIANEAHRKYLEDGEKSRPFEELVRELGL